MKPGCALCQGRPRCAKPQRVFRDQSHSLRGVCDDPPGARARDVGPQQRAHRSRLTAGCRQAKTAAGCQVGRGGTGFGVRAGVSPLCWRIGGLLDACWTLAQGLILRQLNQQRTGSSQLSGSRGRFTDLRPSRRCWNRPAQPGSTRAQAWLSRQHHRSDRHKPPPSYTTGVLLGSESLQSMVVLPWVWSNHDTT
jgi:hypothetical protein